LNTRSIDAPERARRETRTGSSYRFEFSAAMNRRS
jgi:hypothetical protein